MLTKLALAAAAVVSSVSGLELTQETWDAKTAGKTVFVKFLAPWWGHCKKMKPDWDKLMKEFKGDKTRLIADVDCTAGGKSLCETVGVRGYPTIKTGDPNSLEDYNGGRTYDELKKHADSLKPMCSPANIDLCDDDQKKKIEDLQALSAEDLAAKIKEGDDAIAAAEEKLKTNLERLQKEYGDMSKEKDDTIKAIKEGGLGLMKSIQAAAGKKKKGSEEEL